MSDNAVSQVPADRSVHRASIAARRPSDWGPRGPRREDIEDRGRQLDRLFELHGAPDNN